MECNALLRRDPDVVRTDLPTDYFASSVDSMLKVLVVRSRYTDDVTEEEFFHALGGANPSEREQVLPVRFEYFKADSGPDSFPGMFLPVAFETFGDDKPEYWQRYNIAASRARKNEDWRPPLTKVVQSVVSATDRLRANYPYPLPSDLRNRRLLATYRKAVSREKTGAHPLRNEAFPDLIVDGQTYVFRDDSDVLTIELKSGEDSHLVEIPYLRNTDEVPASIHPLG